MKVRKNTDKKLLKIKLSLILNKTFTVFISTVCIRFCEGPWDQKFG